VTFYCDPASLSIEAELSTEIDEHESVPFAGCYPLRILIADKDYIHRRVLFLLLQRLGYEPVTTENGRDCLNATFQDPYDALFTDLEMPEMGGVECAQSIRKAGFKFPIIAITANCSEMTRDQCLAVGMNGFITKPVKLEELKYLLREVRLRKQALPLEEPSSTFHRALLSDTRATERLPLPVRRPVA
jgi:CheY-like chemotaxis protein